MQHTFRQALRHLTPSLEKCTKLSGNGTAQQIHWNLALPPSRLYAHPPDRLKIWKPTSPGQRGRVTVDRYNLAVPHNGPHLGLVKGLSKAGGRNNSGRITVWHRGGGAKRKYRIIDFQHRNQVDGTVKRIEYDPNRSARIALVREEGKGPFNCNGFKYMLAPQGVGAGDMVSSRPDAPIKPGMTLSLSSIPAGTAVHAVELKPGRGGQMCRAAGTSASLVKNEDDGYSVIRLPSGEVRKVLSRCKATVGVVGNALHKNRKLGKAGISRHLGIRPTVRALAMNPRDHPASGKNKKLRKTPWGKVFMGVKTRDKNKPSSRFIVLTRHKAKELRAR